MRLKKKDMKNYLILLMLQGSLLIEQCSIDLT